MNNSSQTGLYGKLPAHGDFIQRNLPSTFITAWDDWLQHFIAGTKEQLGEDWLNIYLTSPIWRFVFSSGVVDENVWSGIMMPSVDRVGRYFPFTIATKLHGSNNPLEFINLQSAWFEKIEEASLLALDGQVLIDDLAQQLSELTINNNSNYQNSGRMPETDNIQLDMEFEEQLPVSVYSSLLDSHLTKTLRSYSVWSTRGSERIQPCLFTTQGLPSVNNVPALIDGQWQQWGWQQPYVLSKY